MRSKSYAIKKFHVKWKILHDEIPQDYFRFQVEVDDELRAEGEFLIHVYPESYWWENEKKEKNKEKKRLQSPICESSSWGI